MMMGIALEMLVIFNHLAWLITQDFSFTQVSTTWWSGHLSMNAIELSSFDYFSRDFPVAWHLEAYLPIKDADIKL
jgi:hypothetical protein